ncbi:MAG: hypothetical protein AB7O64_17795 [Methylibium sp.]
MRSLCPHDNDLDHAAWQNGEEPPTRDVTPQELAAAFERLMAKRFPAKRQDDDPAGLAERNWSQR